MVIEAESFPVGKFEARYDTPNSINSPMRANVLGRGRTNMSVRDLGRCRVQELGAERCALNIESSSVSPVAHRRKWQLHLGVLGTGLAPFGEPLNGLTERISPPHQNSRARLT